MSFLHGDEGIESYYLGQVEASHSSERDEESEEQDEPLTVLESARNIDMMYPAQLRPAIRVRVGVQMVREQRETRVLVAGGRLGKGWAR